MQTALILLENLLQALTAGLLIGSVYATDVRRPRVHLRRDAGHQLRAGRVPDARHVRHALRRSPGSGSAGCSGRTPARSSPRPSPARLYCPRHPAAPSLPRAGHRRAGVRHRGRGPLPAAHPDARPVAHHRRTAASSFSARRRRTSARRSRRPRGSSARSPPTTCRCSSTRRAASRSSSRSRSRSHSTSS